MRIDNHKLTGKNDSHKLNFEQTLGMSNAGISIMSGLRILHCMNYLELITMDILKHKFTARKK